MKKYPLVAMSREYSEGLSFHALTSFESERLLRRGMLRVGSRPLRDSGEVGGGMDDGSSALMQECRNAGMLSIRTAASFAG